MDDYTRGSRKKCAHGRTAPGSFSHDKPFAACFRYASTGETLSAFPAVSNLKAADKSSPMHALMWARHVT